VLLTANVSIVLNCGLEEFEVAVGSLETAAIGKPCESIRRSPAATSVLPIAAGDLAPAASATVSAVIDFSGRAANARFKVNVALSANLGNSSGSIVRLNQFQ
jgi:hypothetical protein